MIVRIPNNCVRHVSDYPPEYELILTSTQGNRVVDGKIQVSLKYKKRRRLISGRLDIRVEDDYGTRYDEYFFYPKNPEKMRALLSQ